MSLNLKLNRYEHKYLIKLPGPVDHAFLHILTFIFSSVCGWYLEIKIGSKLHIIQDTRICTYRGNVIPEVANKMESTVLLNLILFIQLVIISTAKPRTPTTFGPLHEPQFLSRMDRFWEGNETIWQVQFRGQGSPKLILDLRLGFIMGSSRKPGDKDYSCSSLFI